MDNKLLLQDAVSKVAEIDYELLALVLVRFKDLQVRDYAMGLATDENKEGVWLLSDIT